MPAFSVKRQQMLDTVRAMSASGWFSRGDVAERLHKTRLNPSEVAILEVLADQGILERQIVPSDKVEHISKVEYRLVQEATHEKSAIGPG